MQKPNRTLLINSILIDRSNLFFTGSSGKLHKVCLISSETTTSPHKHRYWLNCLCLTKEHVLAGSIDGKILVYCRHSVLLKKTINVSCSEILSMKIKANEVAVGLSCGSFLVYDINTFEIIFSLSINISISSICVIGDSYYISTINGRILEISAKNDHTLFADRSYRFWDMAAIDNLYLAAVSATSKLLFINTNSSSMTQVPLEGTPTAINGANNMVTIGYLNGKFESNPLCSFKVT